MNKVDTMFREVLFRYGRVFTRWRLALDVEILKDPGNINIEKERIIVLIEGDHQLNAKRLSRMVMGRVDKV